MKSCYFRLNITQWHLIISIWVPILSLDIIYPKLFDQHFFTSPKICFNEREWWSHSKKHSSTMWKKKKKNYLTYSTVNKWEGKRRNTVIIAMLYFDTYAYFKIPPVRETKLRWDRKINNRRMKNVEKKVQISNYQWERERIRIYWIL